MGALPMTITCLERGSEAIDGGTLGRQCSHPPHSSGIGSPCNSLNIEKLELKSVDRGGYLVSYNPAPPPGYKVLFGVSPDPWGSVDITGCRHWNVFNSDNLDQLLGMIRRLDAWGTDIAVQLFVTDSGMTVFSHSHKPKTMSCPVKPHVGALLPLENNEPAIKYVYHIVDQHDTKKNLYGRFLWDCNGEKFFTYKGVFETNPEHRGFACIGYVAMTCGLTSADLKKLGKLDSEPLANFLKAERQFVKVPALQPIPIGPRNNLKTEVDISTEPTRLEDFPLENVGAELALEFFAGNPDGYYLVWGDKHIMLVTNGTVYEFNDYLAINANGYKETPVKTRLQLITKGRLHVRKLPEKPKYAR
jgi:hypothetical protein